MLTGIDTSFFFALASGNPLAVEAWQDDDLLTSSLCLFELKGRLLRGEVRSWPTILEDIAKAVEVAPLSPAIALKGARIAHESAMPSVDALILATFCETRCSRALTLDSHLALFAVPGLQLRLLQ